MLKSNFDSFVQVSVPVDIPHYQAVNLLSVLFFRNGLIADRLYGEMPNPCKRSARR